MEQVLSQPDINDPLGLRDRALMETLYSTGMRRLELASLKLYDLDTERGTVTIRQGKGKKDRVIPIGDRAAAWMDKYRPRIEASACWWSLTITRCFSRMPASRSAWII